MRWALVFGQAPAAVGGVPPQIARIYRATPQLPQTTPHLKLRGAPHRHPLPNTAHCSYGRVDLKDSLQLVEAVPALFSGGGIRAEVPDIMEEYGQR